MDIHRTEDIQVILEKCRCGGQPELDNEERVFGHGDFPTVWWIECGCGMATKEIAEGYDGTPDECKQKAADIWNKDHV